MEHGNVIKAKTAISKGITFGKVLIYTRDKELKYDTNSVILVTNEDLTAQDTIKFDWTKIKGIITTKGTKNSHSAIVARQHEVPATIVFNIDDLKEGDFIALNTYSKEEGRIYYYPSKQTTEKLLNELDFLNIKKENLSKYKEDKTVTKDKTPVKVLANLGTSDELPNIHENCAEGIGVVRTEFSYETYDMLEGRLPTEEELYSEYSKISECMRGKNVTIRTLDAGADKPVQSLIDSGVLKENEPNPALGSRGIRPCLDHPDILKTQIRAILRANSKYGNLQIMFPMITSIEELKKGKMIVEEAQADLQQQGMDFKKTSIGIMVETPAIAQITDRLSDYCDFISVGTNDLTQYATAADRMNGTVESIATEYNPGMIRMLKNIIQGAHNGKKRIPVSVCGEIGGDLNYIPILLAMELDKFSMSASKILEARRLISNLTLEECKNLLNEILELDSEEEIRDVATTFYRKKNLEIYEEERKEKEREYKQAKNVTTLKERYPNLTGDKLPDYLNEGER